MLVWRLVNPQFSPGLDGEGARLLGGRWNSPGVPMVYCASSVALTALEVFVHLPASMRQPGKLPQLQLVGLEVDDSALLYRAEMPSMEMAREIGNRWVQERSHLGMLVPSALVPFDQNIVLNPLHAGMANLKIFVEQPFAFDPRLVNA